MKSAFCKRSHQSFSHVFIAHASCSARGISLCDTRHIFAHLQKLRSPSFATRPSSRPPSARIYLHPPKLPTARRDQDGVYVERQKRSTSFHTRSKPTRVSEATHSSHWLYCERPLLTIYYSSVYIGETVTIEVGTGEHKQTFYAHRDLLCFYSGYFKAALNGDFVEARRGMLVLETEEPAVFEQFIKWLYTTRPRKDEIDMEGRSGYFTSIIRLWIFADRRDIPLLMNEMIDDLLRSVCKTSRLPSGLLAELYDNTTENSALRRVVVDMYKSLGGSATAAHMAQNADRYGDYPKQFLYDFTISVLQNRSQGCLSHDEYARRDMCSLFHVHEDGVSCTKKGIKRSRDEAEK